METPELEIFDIPGYEDKYCATKDGRIYSLNKQRFLSQNDDTYGYNTVSLSGKTHKVHRIIAKTFLNNPENHPHIDHINRNRKDNSVSNLRYCSLSQNQLNKNRYTHKSPEYRNIQVKKSTFKVILRRPLGTIYRSFKTLKEAQTFRDSFNQKPVQE
jgi:hypothetical protein